MKEFFDMIGSIFELGLFLLAFAGIFMLVIKCLIVIGNTIF